MKDLYFVLAVAGLGDGGDAFAAGWVATDRGGTVRDLGLASCPPWAAKGNRAFADRVPALPYDCATPAGVRDAVLVAWSKYHAAGARLVVWGDWPPLARFVDDCGLPAPLHADGFAVAAGLDPGRNRATLDPLTAARGAAARLAEAFAARAA